MIAGHWCLPTYWRYWETNARCWTWSGERRPLSYLSLLIFIVEAEFKCLFDKATQIYDVCLSFIIIRLNNIFTFFFNQKECFWVLYLASLTYWNFVLETFFLPFIWDIKNIISTFFRRNERAQNEKQKLKIKKTYFQQPNMLLIFSTSSLSNE
jgi:hypothetical protein